MKYVEDYIFGENRKIFLIENKTDPSDKSLICVYVTNNGKIENKTFYDKKMMVEFLKSFNESSGVIIAGSLVGAPVIRINNFDTEYRFVYGDKSISFYAGRHINKNTGYIYYDEEEYPLNGIHFDEKDLKDI